MMVTADLCPLSPHRLGLLTSGDGCILGRSRQKGSVKAGGIPYQIPSMSPPFLAP